MSDTEWAVVAGASGSLGSAITRRLASRGLMVLALGRRESELTSLVHTIEGVVPCVADVADDGVIDTLRDSVPGPVKIVVQAVGIPIRPKDQPFEPTSVGVGVNIKVGGLLRLTSAVDEFLRPGSRIVALGGYHGFEP